MRSSPFSMARQDTSIIHGWNLWLPSFTKPIFLYLFFILSTSRYYPRMKELTPRGCSQPPHNLHSNQGTRHQTSSSSSSELPSISSSHSSLVGLLRDTNESSSEMDSTSTTGNLTTGTNTNCGAMGVPVIQEPRPCSCRSAIVLRSDPEGRMDQKLADWLTRSVHFAKNIPDVAKLPHKDRVLLLTSAWKELVLLYMAQNDFDFDFLFQSPPYHQNGSNSSSSSPVAKHQDCVSRLWIEGVPTIKSVEQLRFILRKFCEMQPDDKEYAMLRLLLLLNAGKIFFCVCVTI